MAALATLEIIQTVVTVLGSLVTAMLLFKKHCRKRPRYFSHRLHKSDFEDIACCFNAIHLASDLPLVLCRRPKESTYRK